MTNAEFVDRCKAIGLYEDSLATWLEKFESLKARVEELESVISALVIDRDGCYEIISAKQSKVKVLTDALESIALMAHCGGLICMTKDDSMNTIRKLSLPYFDLSMTPNETIEALANVRGK